MARSNLHEQATKLLTALASSGEGDRFEGTLREVAAHAGLNSARSAEAIKLLEELGRIEVVQRGRRDRQTIISINSRRPVGADEAAGARPAAGPRRPRLDLNDLGRAVIDRLLELGKDDALRAAQVEAFARETETARDRISELEQELTTAHERETDLRVKLRAAEEALERAEENLRRVFGGAEAPTAPATVDDADARAVLDILRSGRG